MCLPSWARQYIRTALLIIISDMFSYGMEPQTMFLAPDRSPIELSLFVFKCDANLVYVFKVRGASSMESVKTARQLEKPDGLDDM